MKLDAKGRCCGRKPIKYRREPHYFCSRCDRAYSLDTGEQIANWAWVRTSPYAEFQRNPRYSTVQP
jgi:transposase-like protein